MGESATTDDGCHRAIACNFGAMDALARHLYLSFEHRTSNVQHRTPKDGFAALIPFIKMAECLVRRWAFGVRCWTFGSLLHAIDFDAQSRFNAFQTFLKMAWPQNLYIYVVRPLCVGGVPSPGGRSGGCAGGRQMPHDIAVANSFDLTAQFA
jgi:hypothetical protein